MARNLHFCLETRFDQLYFQPSSSSSSSCRTTGTPVEKYQKIFRSCNPLLTALQPR